MKLSEFGFHDSSIDSLRFNSGTLTLLLSGVEDFRMKGTVNLSTVEVTFEGIRDIEINGGTSVNIEMGSPEGEILSLKVVDKEAQMCFYLDWFEPRRMLSREIQFKFDSVRLTVLGRTEDFQD